MVDSINASSSQIMPDYFQLSSTQSEERKQQEALNKLITDQLNLVLSQINEPQQNSAGGAHEGSGGGEAAGAVGGGGK